MSPITEVRVDRPRPLPVFILADVSGSMSEDGKIAQLNLALRDLIEALGSEQDARGAIQVSVITFGQDSARVHLALTPAGEVQWIDMAASGRTPMGAAFQLLAHLLEDPQTIPERAFQPSLILVSDGLPTDDWVEPLKALKASRRGHGALRMAMAIGADANIAQLEEFVGGPTPPVFMAEDAREIQRFFRWVTMTVTERSRSINPDADPGIELDDIIDV